MTEAATTDTQAAEQPTKDPELKQQFNGNLLYEESLGSVPGAHGGSHNPRFVFAKFKKDYKEFDFTNEDILEKLEEMDLLKYLRLLQISKPNKSIDIMFKTEDAADFFVNQHMEVREKPLSFVRKAKRVEIESSNFQNIREVLGMEPSVHVERAIGTMIAMTGSTRSE